MREERLNASAKFRCGWYSLLSSHRSRYSPHQVNFNFNVIPPSSSPPLLLVGLAALTLRSLFSNPNRRRRIISSFGPGIYLRQINTFLICFLYSKFYSEGSEKTFTLHHIPPFFYLTHVLSSSQGQFFQYHQFISIACRSQGRTTGLEAET